MAGHGTPPLDYSPPQARFAARCLQAISTAANTNRGRVLFLSGALGSGRSHLAAELSTMLRRERGDVTVISGGFGDGGYSPDVPDPGTGRAPQSDVQALIEATVAVGSGLAGPAALLLE